MNKKDSLGDRMKGNYENRSKTFLTRRTPVIIRLDGKSFHTFTRGMKRPYDTILMDTMQHTMLELCKNIQGCKFGYPFNYNFREQDSHDYMRKEIESYWRYNR